MGYEEVRRDGYSLCLSENQASKMQKIAHEYAGPRSKFLQRDIPFGTTVLPRSTTSVCTSRNCTRVTDTLDRLLLQRELGAHGSVRLCFRRLISEDPNPAGATLDCCLHHVRIQSYESWSFADIKIEPFTL